MDLRPSPHLTRFPHSTVVSMDVTPCLDLPSSTSFQRVNLTLVRTVPGESRGVRSDFVDNLTQATSGGHHHVL